MHAAASSGACCAASLKHFLIHAADLSGHVLVSKLFSKALLAVMTQAFSKGLVLCQTNHGIGQLFCVAMFDKDSGLIVDTYFRGTVDVKADDRLTGKKSLRENSCQSFPITRMHDRIGGVQIIGDLIRRDESNETEMAGQTQFRNSSLILIF